MIVNKNIKSYNNATTTEYHLVDLSAMPLLTSASVFIMLSGLVLRFNNNKLDLYTLTIGALLLCFSVLLWFNNIVKEGMQGHHTTSVTKGIRLGFMLFIVSECFLFLGFFWALLHSSIVPSEIFGNVWPPLGVEPLNPWVVPILNAVILLSSGVSVTFAHHYITKGDLDKSIKGLVITIILAAIFLILMYLEYNFALFKINDTVYGSCFYMLTGLHGLHIIVAIIFLIISLYRLKNLEFSSKSFLGLELGILYYHYVDVVFLLVFSLVYWWSSGYDLTII